MHMALLYRSFLNSMELDEIGSGDVVSFEGYSNLYCVKLKGKGSWKLVIASQIPAPVCKSCVTLGKLLNLPCM